MPDAADSVGDIMEYATVDDDEKREDADAVDEERDEMQTDPARLSR